MEKYPERLNNGMVRANGEITPFNAGDAIAALSAYCDAEGIILAPKTKARVGKSAKALLQAGFPPGIVVRACARAVETNWIGSVEDIAQEMQVLSVGKRMSRAQYRESLDEISHYIDTADSLVWQIIRGATHTNGDGR